MTSSLTAPATGSRTTAAPTAPAAVVGLTLTEPMPGFPAHRQFVLVPASGEGLLFWVQSMAVEGPRFLAVAPRFFFPDYAPVVPGPVRAELGLGDGDPQLFCLVTVTGGDVASATANLRAPLVVNPVTGQARQVVLADGGHPIRRPLRR